MSGDGTARIPLLLVLSALLLILLGTLEFSAVLLRLAAVCLGLSVLLLTLLWKRCQARRESDFANSVCETLDALMRGREPENYRPYEDSQLSKTLGKLVQYHDQAQAGQQRSEMDKQTIQELVSDISHQVKTPMTNIRMFTDILRRHELPEEKRAEVLATLTAQVHKLDFLMQSLIKMSRLETGTFTIHMEQANLYDTIARALNGVWAKAEKKNIGLSVECDGLVTAKCDPKWTAEALENLLDNAVKYTEPGGKISVLLQQNRGKTILQVSNTGPEIPYADRKKIFDRFYRVDKARSRENGSYGLGLSIAKTIVSAHHGTISVDCRNSRNIFTVTIS